MLNDEKEKLISKVFNEMVEIESYDRDEAERKILEYIDEKKICMYARELVEVTKKIMDKLIEEEIKNDTQFYYNGYDIVEM